MYRKLGIHTHLTDMGPHCENTYVRVCLGHSMMKYFGPKSWQPKAFSIMSIHNSRAQKMCCCWCRCQDKEGFLHMMGNIRNRTHPRPHYIHTYMYVGIHMQVFVGVGPQRSEVVCDKVPHFSLFIYDIRWGGGTLVKAGKRWHPKKCLPNWFFSWVG
jgi:hypothetical protein